jgi:hypothetical protein
MKRYLYIFLVAILLSACGSSRNSVANTPQDKALISAIKKLDKDPSNTAIQNTLSDLYKDATKVHLDNIEVYETLNDVEKWDKIIREYAALQKVAEIINSSSSAKKFLKIPSFIAEAEIARQNAAADYYNLGLNYLNENDKESSRRAYYAFQKATGFVPGYKDAKRQMDQAYQNSILNIVINPVRDDSYYYNTIGRNRFGNSFNNDYLQRNLVRDLGGNTTNSPARFFTDLDAQRLRLAPDWIIDLTWVNLDIPQPYTQQYNRVVNKQIQIGSDTANKPVYKNVSATLHITRKYFTAVGDLECRITDYQSGNNINLNRYSSQVDWQQEYATYSGDSRALSNVDEAILNNSSYRLPRKEDILNELYQKIYPQVKNGIYNFVRW